MEDDEEDDTVAEFVDAFVLLPPLAFVAFGGFDPLGELTVDVFVPIAAATFGPPDGAAPKFGATVREGSAIRLPPFRLDRLRQDREDVNEALGILWLCCVFRACSAASVPLYTFRLRWTRSPHSPPPLSNLSAPRVIDKSPRTIQKPPTADSCLRLRPLNKEDEKTAFSTSGHVEFQPPVFFLSRSIS